MKGSFLIGVLAVALTCYGQQQTRVLKGKVIDENGASLPYSRVSELTLTNTTLANQRGVFYLQIPAEKAALRISYIGYVTLDTTLYFSSSAGDTVTATFQLMASSRQFDVVNITSEPYQQVFETTNLHILDYSFFGQNILLLVKSREAYQIRLVDHTEKLLTRQNLSFKPLGFVKDCLGILYVVSEDSLFPVHFDSEVFSFPDALPVYDYVTFIQPCVAASDTHFFLEYVSNFGQTIEYISQRKADDTYMHLRIVNDPVKTNDVNNMALELGMMYAPNIMGEISERDLRAANKKFQAETFFKNVITVPAYAPMIKTSNALYVFDHLADSCFVFSLQSIPVRSFKIDYHHRSDWAKKIILDESATGVYAVHQVNGIYSLTEINLETGQLKKSVELLIHTYPEKIKIKNDWIYYLHHPKDDSGFSKLYRVRIPHD